MNQLKKDLEIGYDYLQGGDERLNNVFDKLFSGAVKHFITFSGVAAIVTVSGSNFNIFG
jgi:hypothetical protein